MNTSLLLLSHFLFLLLLLLFYYFYHVSISSSFLSLSVFFAFPFIFFVHINRTFTSLFFCCFLFYLFILFYVFFAFSIQANSKQGSKNLKVDMKEEIRQRSLKRTGVISLSNIIQVIVSERE